MERVRADLGDYVVVDVDFLQVPELLEDASCHRANVVGVDGQSEHGVQPPEHLLLQVPQNHIVVNPQLLQVTKTQECTTFYGEDLIESQGQLI